MITDPPRLASPDFIFIYFLLATNEILHVSCGDLEEKVESVTEENEWSNDEAVCRTARADQVC